MNKKYDEISEALKSDFPCADRTLASAQEHPEEMQHLCSEHLDMTGREVENLKARLEPGHVLHTMICEHEMILKFLDDLDRVSQRIESFVRFDSKQDEFEKLRGIASHLIGAEAHHQREEEVLFPEVEKRGMLGPPQMMRWEHEELRKRKRAVHDLAYKVGGSNFDSFKKSLQPESQGLVTMLRDHIFKENNILYPMALQLISAKGDWDRMKAECDKIGYCCFTPKT